jgi:hypothetical protein
MFQIEFLFDEFPILGSPLMWRSIRSGGLPYFDLWWTPGWDVYLNLFIN